MKHIIFRLKALLPQSTRQAPTLTFSTLPLAAMLCVLLAMIATGEATSIADYSPFILLGAATMSIVIAAAKGWLSRRGLTTGLARSAGQILPAVPMLVCIAMIAATWMLSGVVPLLITYGLSVLSPELFLPLTAVVCGFISILTGSSWSTIATIGVAFMGIGSVMGFHPGMVAGAIISGAYFGDKVSPLSDTTVISASTCGVDLFTHIRYMLVTTLPAMLIALIVFTVLSLGGGNPDDGTAATITGGLEGLFNLSPWLLVIPAVTFGLIALRVPTLITLFTSSMLGLAGIFIFQPQISEGIGGGTAAMIWQTLWGEVSFATGSTTLDALVATSGISGMLPTVFLVLSAMLFGAAMIGTGMLATLTEAITAPLRRRFPLVGATAASGLLLNSCTADQYLSIIVGGNMFRGAYRRCGLEPRLLSRTLEDSVSVTSVLIPWNSCGVTQSAVLGVPTLIYFPFCIFNYLSPLMTLLISLTGLGIRQRSVRPVTGGATA